jgi:hypothetical protein
LRWLISQTHWSADAYRSVYHGILPHGVREADREVAADRARNFLKRHPKSPRPTVQNVDVLQRWSKVADPRADQLVDAVHLLAGVTRVPPGWRSFSPATHRRRI